MFFTFSCTGGAYEEIRKYLEGEKKTLSHLLSLSSPPSSVVYKELTVVLTNPYHTETKVSLTKEISVSFSENILSETVSEESFSVYDNSNTIIQGTISVLGANLGFKPEKAWNPETQYTVKLKTGIKSVSGQALSTEYVFSFTSLSSDREAPILVSTAPEHDADNIPIDTVITLTYNEAIIVDPACCILSVNGDVIAGTVEVEDKVIRFIPSINLLAEYEHTFTILPGVRDSEGNQTESSYSFTFFTKDTLPPKLVKTYPKQNMYGASIRRKVELEYDEGINASSVTGKVRLKKGDIAIPAELEVRGSVIYLIPADILEEKTVYSIEIDAGIADVYGNQTTEAIQYLFKTGIPMQLSSYGNHTCALLPDGKIRCWGLNNHGQLGHFDSITVNDATKSKVLNLEEPAIQISCGYEHTCALLESGGVKCWGRGSEGQLGYGNYDDIKDVEKALYLNLKKEVKKIEAGYDVTCALYTSGSFICWGNSESGLLGWEDTSNLFNLPDDVNDVYLRGKEIILNKKVRDISVSYLHSCLILEDGSFRCWGLDKSTIGFLGYPGYPLYFTPIGLDDIVLNKEVIQIETGYDFSCSLKDDKQVRCWGKSDKYQSGVFANDLNDATNLNDLELSGNILQIATGFKHSCALLENYKITCWGLNNSHQVSPMSLNSIYPVLLESEKTCVQVIAGIYHSCAVMLDDSITCWGNNTEGQLGHVYSEGNENIDINHSQIFDFRGIE